MGIRVIKFYAWENSFLQKTLGFRNLELKQIRNAMVLGTVSATFLGLSPLFVSLSTFTLYVLLGNTLKASIIFPALGYFNMLRFPLFLLPNIVTSLAESRVSIRRLNAFLHAEEITPVNVEDDATTSIKITNGDFAWKTTTATSGPEHEKTNSKKKKKKGQGSYSKLDEKEAESPTDDDNVNEDEDKEEEEKESTIGTLKNINLTVPKGSLTAIVGLVGSGKVCSFLLLCFVHQSNKY